MNTISSNYSLSLAHPARQNGFSLIELMVAMTIGLVLLAGLFYVYIGASQSSRFQGALAVMQTNARYAFELMGVDIRMLGFTGSREASSSATNAVAMSLTSHLCPLIDIFGNKNCTDGAGPLLGYENGKPPTAPATCVGAGTSCYLPDTDALTVVRVDTANKYTLSVLPTLTSCTLSSWPTSNAPVVGEIFVAADYTHAAVFKVSAIDTTAKTVSYTTGTLGTFSGYKAMGLYRLSGVSYYIGRNPVGEPALYRDKLSQTGGSESSVQEELIQGIEDMQITYGVDTDPDATPPLRPGDGSVNGYWTADQVNAGTNGTPIQSAICNTSTSDHWKCVISVRITLTLVSGKNEKIGTTGDRLLRKTFTNTIAIRNRLL